METLTAPAVVTHDLPDGLYDDDGPVEVVVNVTSEGIIVDFYDPEYTSGPFASVARTWSELVEQVV